MGWVFALLDLINWRVLKCAVVLYGVRPVSQSWKVATDTARGVFGSMGSCAPAVVDA